MSGFGRLGSGGCWWKPDGLLALHILAFCFGIWHLALAAVEEVKIQYLIQWNWWMLDAVYIGEINVISNAIFDHCATSMHDVVLNK